MERTPVRSTDLVSVGYDFTSSVLEVEFNGGAIYRYSGVSEDVYQGLMNAPSKGRYFNQHIRKAKYPYRKIS